MANSVLTISQVRIKLPNTVGVSQTNQVKVNPIGAAQTPVTLKNVAGDIPTLQQLRNVNVQTTTGGEILVYNANTGKFDMRDLTGNDVDLSSVNFDGGSF